MTTPVMICKVFSRTLDVVVVGSGPAGLAAALHCAALGMHVVCVAPDTQQPWPANYAAWTHELHGLAARCVQTSWRQAQVCWDETPHTITASYARLDRLKLQREMHERCHALGVRFVDGRVTEVTHGQSSSRLTTDAGELDARVVIDASGAASPFVKRVDERPAAFQTAYGMLIEVESHPYPLDTMVFMDLSEAETLDAGAPHARSGSMAADDTQARDRKPTFLYAMPLSPTQLFVEETSLVARPPLSMAVLRARLLRRMSRLGLRAQQVHEVERCVIPMGIAPPAAGQRLVPFGAAAAMVHPATGYQLSRVLSSAPLLAISIADGLEQGGPVQAADSAMQALWPAEQRRCWELYTFGMEALCRFDSDQLRTFMRAFFDLPEPLWRGYLAAELSFGALFKAMWGVFSAADSTLRWQLVRLSTGGGARRLWSALSIPNQV